MKSCQALVKRWKNNTTGGRNVIQVPVTDTKTEVVKLELTGDTVKKPERNTFVVSVMRNHIAAQ